MLKIHTAILLPLFILNMNGGGFRFFNDETIALIIVGIILIHIFSIAAYVNRMQLLRYICAVLYLPIMFITLVIAMLAPPFLGLFIPSLLFYIFVIVKKRK